MAEIKKYIAVDLGAESGRVMLGTVSDKKLKLDHIHRFPNKPIDQDGSLKWDFDDLFEQVKEGIAKAVKAANTQVWGIGIDSWGVDFGLIDSDGKLIEAPYHYRDSRTDGMMEKAFELMEKRRIYDRTGIQFMQLNTIYQLLAMKQNNSIALAQAKKLIFMADLIAYYLSKRIFSEYTLASTSQLMDMNTGKWAKDIFENLSLPIDLMAKIVKPGTVVGQIVATVGNKIGCGPIPIIAVGSHDTACAVASVPAEGENWAYLSCGTWSLMGIESPQPQINDDTFKYQFTNEGGVADTIRMLKNIMGLWLVQECRRQWQLEGKEFSYSQLTEMAQDAKPFTAFINPSAGEFLAPGDMPARINKYQSQRRRKKITDKGQMIRVILESLAFNYRWVLEKIEQITQKNIDVIHIVGGGIQNELLCRFTADATGKRVIAGPVEATATGNIIMQAIATGQIDTIADGRKIIANSYQLKEYEPVETEKWDKQYKKVVKALDAC